MNGGLYNELTGVMNIGTKKWAKERRFNSVPILDHTSGNYNPNTMDIRFRKGHSNYHVRRSNCCSNCNVKGHMFKECRKPIRSFGIIAFRIRCGGGGKGSLIDQLEVCLIRRKNTISYEAFMRGKYKMDELDVHLDRMTSGEKNRILCLNWDDLYSQICYHKTSRYAQRERRRAKELYNSLDRDKLFGGGSGWFEPEWEFPKGRKYVEESEEECALREFNEETNIDNKFVSVLNNTFFESFVGVDKRVYKNQYFLGLVRRGANEPYIDLHSKNQITEIGDVKWVSIVAALSMIRSYHKQKKDLLLDAVDNILSYVVI